MIAHLSHSTERFKTMCDVPYDEVHKHNGESNVIEHPDLPHLGTLCVLCIESSIKRRAVHLEIGKAYQVDTAYGEFQVRPHLPQEAGRRWDVHMPEKPYLVTHHYLHDAFQSIRNWVMQRAFPYRSVHTVNPATTRNGLVIKSTETYCGRLLCSISTPNERWTRRLVHLDHGEHPCEVCYTKSPSN